MEETISQVAAATGVEGLSEEQIRAGVEYVHALCVNPLIHLMTSYVRECYDRTTRTGNPSSDQIASANGLLTDLETLSRKSPNTAAVSTMLQGIDDPFVIQFICSSRRKDLQIFIPDDNGYTLQTYAKLEESVMAYWLTFKTEHARIVKRVCRFLGVADLAIVKTGRNIDLAPGYDTILCVYSSFVALRDDNDRAIKKNDRYQLRGTNPSHAKAAAPSEPTPQNAE